MPRISLGPDVPRALNGTWESPTIQAWYVDVCRHCWREIRRENPCLARSVVRHGPYQSQHPAIQCWLCRALLGPEDNA